MIDSLRTHGGFLLSIGLAMSLSMYIFSHSRFSLDVKASFSFLGSSSMTYVGRGIDSCFFKGLLLLSFIEIRLLTKPVSMLAKRVNNGLGDSRYLDI
jgi:hypothetical protein